MICSICEDTQTIWVGPREERGCPYCPDDPSAIRPCDGSPLSPDLRRMRSYEALANEMAGCLLSLEDYHDCPAAVTDASAEKVRAVLDKLRAIGGDA